MIRSKSVSICNHSRARLVDSSRNRAFWRGYPNLMHSYGELLRHKGSILKPLKSHAHTVVWECCKGDHQSQWERVKFDTQPTLNPSTDRHQIWNVITSRTPTAKKLGSIRAGGSSLHIRTYAKFTVVKRSNVQLFLVVLPLAYRRDSWTDFDAPPWIPLGKPVSLPFLWSLT